MRSTRGKPLGGGRIPRQRAYTDHHQSESDFGDGGGNGVHVDGERHEFPSRSPVQWNGAALTTTFVSSTQLTAAVPASLIASAGSANITAINTGGSASAATAFPITAPTPTITGLSPISATAGGAAFTLTVNGTNFLAGAVVQWNGTALTTTFVSSGAVMDCSWLEPITTFVSTTQLTAAVAATLIASAGSANITAVNTGGSASTAVDLPLTRPHPPSPA